jgi:hypothetical protein
MPLDPAFDDDDSQPWRQMGSPLRITVHPASPPSPQANNSAASQGLESDGNPNDWIAPAGARPALQSLADKIAPAKAAADGSVPYGSIESDGYPNDWIEPDGYPDDRVVPGQTRAPGTGFPGIGRPSASDSTSRPQPQTDYGGYDAGRPGDHAIPSAFQQPSPSTLVVPVSGNATTRPAWVPLGPGTGWEPWADQFIKGMQGLINQFRSRSGASAPSGGDGDDCYERWEREDARCKRFQPFEDKRYFRACKERASARRDLCMRNGGRPDPEEPAEYDYGDFM